MSNPNSDTAAVFRAFADAIDPRLLLPEERAGLEKSADEYVVTASNNCSLIAGLLDPVPPQSLASNPPPRDDVTASLRLHQDDPRMAGGFKVKVARDEIPAALSVVVGIWPSEPDGTYKIALSDVGGALVWRAYAIAEIGAGRGRLAAVDEYAKRLGVVHFDEAFAYICDQMRGRRIRPCRDADHDCWAEATRWVTCDGHTVEPRRRWARSAWHGRASTHEAFAAAGLVVPGRSTWNPQATMLFVTPRPEPQPASTTLTQAEDAALARLAVF